jgi:hypothetical protein
MFGTTDDKWSASVPFFLKEKKTKKKKKRKNSSSKEGGDFRRGEAALGPDLT